jgi:apolipoprotein N-acyltransferase
MNNLTTFLRRHAKWAALVGGAVSATGFAPLHLWPLALLGLASLIYFVSQAKSRKQAAIIGWIFGTAHFFIANMWIAVAFTFQAAMPVWLGYLAVVALACYLAFFPAIAALGAWQVGDMVRKRRLNATIPYALAFAGMWILTEWARSCLFTGYAWNPLSAIAIDVFPATSMRMIGTYGLSGIVLLFSAILLGLIGAVLTLQWKAIFARGLDVALLSGLTAAFGWFGSGAVILPAHKPTAITIAQPNISQTDKYKQGYEEANFAKLAAVSRPLKGQGPRLLLWPEAAIPYQLESGYPYRFYQFQPGESAVGARMALASLMGAGDVLLTGADRLEIDADGQLVGARNSMIAMGADTDILGHYDKAHLVPFGEYLPLPWLLKPLGLARLVPGDLDFWPGLGPQTLDLGRDESGQSRGKVGFQICYEIIFSGRVVDRNNRPDFIFNSSNDAWFGTIGPPQHLVQARMRAIEEGLPIIRSTPTGISAIIDADGEILQSLKLGASGRIDGKLPPAHAPTVFARFGNALPLGLAAMLLLFAFLPVVSRRTSR